jgi:hypothetical protein
MAAPNIFADRRAPVYLTLRDAVEYILCCANNPIYANQLAAAYTAVGLNITPTRIQQAAAAYIANNNAANNTELIGIDC